MTGVGLASKRLAALAVVGLSLASAAPAAGARGVDLFHSPSGNIACGIAFGAARCDIRAHDWSPPPKPADCNLDWGYGLTVGRHGRGDFFCGGDTVFGPGRVLPYGSTARHGDLRCTMAESGVTCVNSATGHGFKLSRAHYRRF